MMINKYMLDWHDSGINNAAGKKAKEDVMHFLHMEGWRDIATPTNKYAKVLWSIGVAPFKFAAIKSGYILVQFPSEMSMLRKMNIDNIKRFSKAKLIILIHDIETLRDWQDGDHQAEINQEMNLLKQADGIIVQTQQEKQFLESQGIHKVMVILNFFDYLNPHAMIANDTYQGTICWAGNLRHAPFLQKLKLHHQLDTYGPKVDFDNPAIVYQGNFLPEELPKYLHENFGLVWNGTSVHTCDGTYGNYMRYNAPHKVSLYLSCGMPIITWSQAANAEYIVKHKIGLIIDDLSKLDELLDSVTTEQYQELQQNAQAIGQKIREGYFINHATDEIIKML